MIKHDLHNNIKVTNVLDPVVVSGGAGAVEPDNYVNNVDFQANEFLISVGQSGDTLSGSLKLHFQVWEADEDDQSDAAVVTDQDDLIGQTIDGSGNFGTIDDAAEDDVCIKVGYVGRKKYSGIKPVKTGTHSTGTPVAIIGLQGSPARCPVT